MPNHYFMYPPTYMQGKQLFKGLQLCTFQLSKSLVHEIKLGDIAVK